MRIFLIRHGESIKSGEDTILTEEGKEQGKKIALFLKNIKVDKVYVSELTRAKQTSEEYKKISNFVEIQTTPELNEIYRVIIGGPSKDGTSPNREEKDKKRADTLFDRLLNSKDEIVFLFTHGNLIRYFIARTLKVNPKKFWQSLVISPGSISIIEKIEDHWQVNAVNIISHLNSKVVDNFYKGEVKSEKYFS